MANLYLVTGPAGVGKSTISRKIAESLPKSVLLEGDDFYHHVVGSYISPWKEGNHLELFFKVCIDTINNYLDAGYDVVFNYIIDKETFETLKPVFKDINTKFVVLMVDEETILKRDKERPEDCRMNERCLVLLKEFKDDNYESKYILDTSNISIDDTLSEILNNDRFII